MIWLAVRAEVDVAELRERRIGACHVRVHPRRLRAPSPRRGRRPACALPLSLIATGSPVRRFRPHPEDVPMSRSSPSATYATGTR